MILNYYVSQLKELLGNDADDRFLIAQLNEARAVWIKNELSKGRSIDDDIKQTLSCIEMKVVDESECPYVSSNARILKSVNKIPKTIIRAHKDSIMNVRNSRILSQRYNYIPKEQAIYAGSGKTNSKSIFCFLYNEHLYIKFLKNNPKIPLIDYISIEGIFEDPTEISNINCCNGPCYDILTMDYPISNNLWVYIKSQFLPKDESKNSV